MLYKLLHVNLLLILEWTRAFHARVFSDGSAVLRPICFCCFFLSFLSLYFPVSAVHVDFLHLPFKISMNAMSLHYIHFEILHGHPPSSFPLSPFHVSVLILSFCSPPSSLLSFSVSQPQNFNRTVPKEPHELSRKEAEFRDSSRGLFSSFLRGRGPKIKDLQRFSKISDDFPGFSSFPRGRGPKIYNFRRFSFRGFLSFPRGRGLKINDFRRFSTIFNDFRGFSSFPRGRGPKINDFRRFSTIFDDFR